MIEDADAGRDLAALVVPQAGRLVATGNGYEPYRLVDADGVVTEAASHLRAFPDQVGHVDRRFGPRRVAQRDQDTSDTQTAQCLAGHGAADALDNHVNAPAIVARLGVKLLA